MAETPLTIGADVSCTDGSCGKVTRVVMDPVARAVTHLVVEPKHHRGPGRLVPLGLADTAMGQIRLRCTMAEFENLEPAVEAHFLPGGSVYPGYERDQVRTLPLYAGGWGMGGREVGSPGGGSGPTAASYDAVPLDEVQVRRGERVYAGDGTIGRVQGLVERVQVTLFPVITGRTGTDPIFQGAAEFDLELIDSRTRGDAPSSWPGTRQAMRQVYGVLGQFAARENPGQATIGR